jgi:hypothetical protein
VPAGCVCRHGIPRHPGRESCARGGWAGRRDCVAPRHHDCADLLAGAFVHQHRFDLEATAAGILRGRLVIVQDIQLGSGAWACLAADKQHELTAAGIRDDTSLSAAVRTTRRDFDQADRLGSLAQSNGAYVYVYRLSRPVRTHDLVSDTGPGEWIRSVLRQPARPRLEEIRRTDSILLLVRLDQLGKVDRFGFVDNATD